MGLVLLILITLLIVNIYIIVQTVTPASEGFKNQIFKPKNQPLFFPKHISTFPKNCQPHLGCTNKSKAIYPSNKIGFLNDGPIQQIKPCSKAWRDCHAYQNCVKGKCKANN